MEIKYFDSHSHLNFSQYDEDREEIINEMHKQGVATICVGTSEKTSRESVELASAHEHIWATVGLHPTDEEDFDTKTYKEMLTDRVVAIGECGLDYFREKNRTDEDKERQKKIFIQQIEFALEQNLPLMIHCRPSAGNMDAYEDALEILENYADKHGEKIRGNSHFFVGSSPVLDRFLKLGFTIAFPGVITFAREYDEVIKRVPLDKILCETDAPFASPVPYRGKRNNPMYVSEVVKEIAAVRGESEDLVNEALVSNIKRVFGIN